MNKRILATLCITIFALSAIATVNQVSAHYTLGDQLAGNIGETLAGGLPVQPTSGAGNGLPRYHVPPNGNNMAFQSWGGHVPGHISFVRPGTLYVPPSDQFNYYSPDGAVLTDTVGDLFVYICIADDVLGQSERWDGQSGPINISWRGQSDNFVSRLPFSLFEPRRHIYIAIPPEFTPQTSRPQSPMTTNSSRPESSVHAIQLHPTGGSSESHPTQHTTQQQNSSTLIMLMRQTHSTQLMNVISSTHTSKTQQATTLTSSMLMIQTMLAVQDSFIHQVWTPGLTARSVQLILMVMNRNSQAATESRFST